MLNKQLSAMDFAAAPECPDTPPIESLKLAPLISPLSSMHEKQMLNHSSQNLSAELLNVPPQEDAVAAPPACGPRSMEVAITFDTTGSMSQCLEQVQAQVNQMIERLFMDIPDLKIAVIAHGDYCDEEHFYVTQHVDFTNQLPTLASFVKDVGGTGGGDWEECYEYVLNLARTKLSWTPGTQRALVMIGDAAPHPPNSEASRGYDWRMEVGQLNREMGVSVYGVQCLKEDKATPFWAELAERTAGRHLQLDQVGSVVDMIMAIVYREHGAGFFDAYEQEVRAREGNGMRHELEDMFHRLRDEDRPTKRPAQGDASPAKRACKAAKANKAEPNVKRAEPKAKRTEAKAKRTEPKAKRAEAKAKRTEPKAKRTEPKAKRAEAKAKRAEPKAKRAEPKAKRTEAKAKRTEPKPKVLKNKKPTRESVQQSHFVLNTLRWSPWRKAMSLVAPDDGAQWMPRRGAEPGFRNASLFTDSKRSKPAVYEFAVQTGAHRKLHVVFFRCSRTIPTGCRWDRHLLRGAGIQAMVSKVLKQRAADNHVILMARRAILPESGVEVAGKQHMGSRGVAALLKTRYDYAWRPCSDRRQEITRPVQRNQCFISQ